MARSTALATTKRNATNSTGGTAVTPSFATIQVLLHASATKPNASEVSNRDGTTTSSHLESEYDSGVPLSVFITGITGFVGSHLAERALARGHLVHGLAHEDPPFHNLVAVADRVRVHRGDVTDAGAVERAIAAARPDVIVHLAGMAVPTHAGRDPLAAVRVNVLGTATVVQAAREHPGIRLVHASTAEVYGGHGDVASSEGSPLHATNVYVATKIAAEPIVRELGDGGANVATILRPANQVGPRLHPDLVVSAFARQIALIEIGRAEPVVKHGRLDAKRDMLDIRDMADAYLMATELRHDRTATYNVGTGSPAAIGDVLATLCGLARVAVRTELDPARLRSGDPGVVSVDATRFRERTGWEPRIPLERSLADTLDYWRESVRSEAAVIA
ncbi:MAG: GDP-mannose 4,6-dehydratase [Chloroflexi bacterium]|nr:GDP-mannose 4,6-dehydratase [Chloroflexota bacterium]